jgi:tRNA-splicing ligase RtcB
MKYFKEEGKVIKCWCNSPEEGAIKQAKNLSTLPFLYKHVALMPDVHQGYGMPIGGVVACKGYIIPNAVGVDIGCGMIAIKTSFKDNIKKEILKKILGVVRSVVPMGMGKNHKSPCGETFMPNLPHSDFVQTLIDPTRYQLGTLGSGNHFIEFQRDEENNLWIMIHSGSRKLGKAICDYHNNIARELNKRYFSIVDDKQELAFLSMNTIEGLSYFEDMLYATNFALRNRQKMMNKTTDVLKNCLLKYDGKKIHFEDIINIHHNYASLENHFGENVYVHRKGATSARKGEIGIIPSSQGTCSYIVEGLGNPESFMSCSHGAGRKLGRKAAKRELNLEKEIKYMEDRNIIHNIRNVEDLDEAKGSYKDIDVVMDEQKDLVKIKYKLRPIAVLKG